MKVYLNRNPAAAYKCDLKEGETGEVDTDTGRRMVAAGFAECLDEPEKAKPVIKAIPDEPAIADAKAPAIAPAKIEPKPPKVAADKKQPQETKPQPKNKDK